MRMLEFNAKEPVTFLNQLRWDKIALNSLRWALTGKGPMATQVNSCNVVIRTAEQLDRPDLQIMVNPIRFDAQPWFPGIRKVQDHVFWAGIVQLHPESRGWVELKSNDPREVASVTLNILADRRRPGADAPTRSALRARSTTPSRWADLIVSERTPGVQVESDDDLDAYHPRDLPTSPSTRPAPARWGWANARWSTVS